MSSNSKKRRSSPKTAPIDFNQIVTDNDFEGTYTQSYVDVMGGPKEFKALVERYGHTVEVDFETGKTHVKKSVKAAE